MGDPALADESLIVDYLYHDDPVKWPHRKAMFQIKSNYMPMIDNLMDLTHLGYVHGSTIGGNPLGHVGADMDSHKHQEKGAYFIRWMPGARSAPDVPEGRPVHGQVDRWQEFEYVGPSIVLQWSGALAVGDGAQEDREKDGFHLRLLHAATPETENHVPLFLVDRERHRQDDPNATQEMYDEIYPTFIKTR